MSDETNVDVTAQTDDTTEGTDTVNELDNVQQVEETEVAEAETNVTEEQSDDVDIVSEALSENERLKAELEALKNSDKDIFEENAQLKADLEEAQKLAKLAEENAQLQAKLEGIKREAITKQLIASGALTKSMVEWADSLTFTQLQEFAKMAPKKKNILQQTNETEVSQPALDMEAWKREQMKSRIIS